MIRGGHIDVTFLGGLQVCQAGNLANWIIPGKLVKGMGGAMDLVSGSPKTVVMMEHSAKGNAKILDECSLPLTGKGVVDMLITELALFTWTKERKMVLKELAPGVSVEEVRSQTKANFEVAADIKEFAI